MSPGPPLSTVAPFAAMSVLFPAPPSSTGEWQPLGAVMMLPGAAVGSTLKPVSVSRVGTNADQHNVCPMGLIAAQRKYGTLGGHHRKVVGDAAARDRQNGGVGII